MIQSLNPGTGWVVAQAILLVLQIVEPVVATTRGLGPGRWGTSWSGVELPLGTALMLAGGALALRAVRALGHSLSPLPKPKDDSVLVVRGPYRVLRHPIYTALLLACLGWAMIWKDPVLIVLFTLLAVVFLFKSRLEEKWLTRRYPDYALYKKKTGGLVPRLFR